ncbi:hypothetical protein ILUMI_16651 [Ignelater luminosus]|uniref:DDE-1 domain-containing protein n=1 Tax=Ignelater luminosus TaxID=2038154 RepID=A0A8K0CSI6_IGNLU|nr:hypothetical protein ILUMI_16651 [Ignelater luminosus]
MCFGLTMRDLRKMAHETAVKINLQMPDAWGFKEIACKEWTFGFMKRHPPFSLQNLEACSLSRATAFNKYNVNTFFKISQYGNGFTTIQTPKRVIAQKGCKQVSSVTTAERGQLVTVCNIICARSHALPPAMRDLFYEGNPKSHIFLDVINLARENGVTIVTMPPHCSHLLQPLDVAVYGPLKKHYNTAMDQLMKDHTGTPMSIYDISGCFGVAFGRTTTPTHILASLRRTGIVHFDRHVFTDTDFLPSSVTDRPMPTILNTTVGVDLMFATAGGSSTNKESKKLDENTDFISSKEFIRYPKAKLRKENPNKRRRVVSCILTDTPQKEDLERRDEEKKSKKNQKAKVRPRSTFLVFRGIRTGNV